MKRLLAATLALMFATPAAAEWRAANEEAAQAATEPRIAAALAAVNAVDAALIGDDREAFADALAEDLAVNNPQNSISRRNMTVSLNAAGRISYARYDRAIEYAGLRDDLVVLMGEERVVPRGETPNAGREVVRRFTDVWREEDGRWRLTARQATIVAVE